MCEHDNNDNNESQIIQSQSFFFKSKVILICLNLFKKLLRVLSELVYQWL